MTTRDDARLSVESAEWINLRDERGRIQARYCPSLQLLMIQERKVRTVHDLSRYTTSDAVMIDETERAC